jgi:hypothetical protein
MTDKKPDLDSATIAVMKRMLSAPPKLHEKMKVGRHQQKTDDAKDRAVSAKRRSASKTASD